MKPKAKKFRIRRAGPTAPASALAESAAQAKDAATRNAAPPDATAPRPRPAPATGTPEGARPARRMPANTAPDAAAAAQPAYQGDVASARETQVEAEIDAIRREGLTGRQLRMARRVAQKHGLAPTSDFDAVRLLRAEGIDPFQRTNMLELVVPNANRQDGDAGQPPAESGKVQLPQTVPVKKVQLPSTETETESPAARREQEIMAMQRDIARRRRRKTALLFTRLSFFVFLPTLLAGWYYFAVATPMYASKSEFLILQADNAGGGGIGGLLSGTQFATNQDAIAVQSYLQSKDAMQRLDRDAGFVAHFTQDWIDPIQRLGDDPSLEDAYRLYKRNFTIGYDPTEGVIRMEVAAADPEVSAEFSRRLISYAEERVDNQSRRKREDQMRDAMESFEQAEADRRAAQEQLVRLQQENAILDPEGKIASLRTQINTYEAGESHLSFDSCAELDS